MNLIAVDIGNSNIDIGLFLKGEEKSVESISGDSKGKLTKCLKSTWEKIPVAKRSKQGKRDGVIVVSSVKPHWTQLIRKIVKEELGEKILIVGKDIPYPIELGIKEKDKIGADRVISAAAAYAVVERAVVVADFGTAVTIDLVDDRGVFDGGTIFPGFEASAKALKDNTAQLPQVKVRRPKLPFGKNTTDAINCGLYYSAIGALQEIIRRYAEKIGTWPQTVITGRAAEMIKDDCQFIDTYVPNLVIKGIALAYRKWLETKE
jgi:type III pantothenate kinase